VTVGRVGVILSGDLAAITAFLETRPGGIDVSIGPTHEPEPTPARVQTLGEFLKGYLERNGMLNCEFAARINVDKSTIGRVINKNLCSRLTASRIRRYISENP
jgi:hypothetical protein